MHTFDTTSPVTAVVDIAAGRVQLIAADRPDTTVEVRPADPAKGRDVKAAERTTVTFADGVVRVVTTARHEIVGVSGSIEVTVQLPAGSHVDAKAASAEVRGVGRLGEVAFEGAQGEIRVDEVAGARIVTQAGDVAIGRLTGPAEVRTQKGSIQVDEAVRGAVELSTQAGDITVGTPAGTSATLDAGATYGRITNGLRNTGEPAVTFRATTSYGDITAATR
ncbi:DUF4097 family beta strand repeat-containing protein [Xylanimonas sp. McL0601]|uniref:DUF4097 family beta strand repeat-containing protein n=1 Tax=Xylanimonas sp. McL0601 TaxID=3414739 RepID=UPI003CF9CC77